VNYFSMSSNSAASIVLSINLSQPYPTTLSRQVSASFSTPKSYGTIRLSINYSYIVKLDGCSVGGLLLTLVGRGEREKQETKGFVQGGIFDELMYGWMIHGYW